MLSYLLFPFYNREERRLRALWRLLLQLGASVLLLLPGAAVAILLFARSQGLPYEGIPFIHPTPIAEQTIAQEPLMNMLVITLAGVAAVLSVWLVGKFVDRRPFADFGLHIDRAWWWDVGAGALIGAILAAIVFVVERSLGWVTVTAFFQSSIRGLPFVLAFVPPVLFFIGISVSEELAVRGYMLTNTAEGLNLRFLGPRVALLLALAITAANFGLGHEGAGLSTINIALAGAWLAATYILTGELALALGIHFTWNLFQGNVFGFPVSGNVFDATTVIAIEQSGPALWTGGSYGPEAGLLGTLAFALGILLVLVWIRYSRGSLTLHTAIAEYPPQSDEGTAATATERRRAEPPPSPKAAQTVNEAH